MFFHAKYITSQNIVLLITLFSEFRRAHTSHRLKCKIILTVVNLMFLEWITLSCLLIAVILLFLVG